MAAEVPGDELSHLRFVYFLASEPAVGASSSATSSKQAAKVAAPLVPAQPKEKKEKPAKAAAAAPASASPASAAATAGTPSSDAATPAAATPTAAASAVPQEEDPATHLRVLAKLRAAGVTFTELTHAPTRTSEESAAVRGVPLATGAKAMLLKANKMLEHGTPYVLAVLSAARKSELSKLRALLGCKSISLASEADVKALTGCLPGAVPPFGSLFGPVAGHVRTLVDPSLLSQERINFNSGVRTHSVGMSLADYLVVEAPTVMAFAADAQ